MTDTDPSGAASLDGSADDLIVIFEDDDVPARQCRPKWKVAVIDDDPAVQDGTRFALSDFNVDGHELELLSAASAAEGRALLAAHPDIAVVLLDVVMESDTAGLELVQFIRRDLKNDLVRIVLRTGQPGQAPERSVIVDYDINDYKAKTELTAAKLFTTMIAALRGYQQLHKITATRRGLEIIMEATASLGSLRSLHLLAEGILTQLVSLLDVECAGILVLREERASQESFKVLAGSGRYSALAAHDRPAHLDSALVGTVELAFATRQSEFSSERTVLFIGSESGAELVAVLDADKHMTDTDRALLGIFCNRLSAALENFMLSEQIREANRDLEVRVASRTRELASANRRLHDQWQRARRAKAFQSEILSTVAHDLKNPLTVVLGRADVLTRMIGRSPLQPERCVTQLGQIRDSATRMTAMVDRLVGEAMADAVNVTIRREIGDLVGLVHEVVEANRPLCEAKRQTIAVEAPELIEAAFDQDRLRDAFDNLVSNAIKYSPHGGRILIKALREPAEAVVTVSDEGPGLQPEDRERLFGRFERLSAKPTGGESSTGLGLFSAKQIVDLHGGSLAALPVGPGQGTTFEMRLPFGEVAALRLEADQT